MLDPAPQTTLHRAGSARSRRIVVFMYDFELSGVVTNAIRLANALVAEGHDVRFLVGRRDGSDGHSIDPRIAIEVVAGVPQGARGIDLFRRLRRLRSAIRQMQPDILLSAGNHGHLPALLAALGLRGLERVLRVSNEPDHPGDNAALRGARRLMLEALVRLSDRMLLVSPRLARHPAMVRATRSGRTTVIPNGVPADEIRRRAKDPCDHPWAESNIPLVIAVGRLARQKNLPTLVEAVAIANQTRPVRLLIVGRGSTTAQTALMGLARVRGIGDLVQCVGEQANPFPYLRVADVFAMPSLWEGRSNALLEAMACDVPIVASRTAGDAAQLLGHGRYGLLVDPMAADEMAEAILIQLGPEPCRPGKRVAEFDQQQALQRACAAVIDAPKQFALCPSSG